MEKIRRDAALHPDDLLFSLLGKGLETRCFNGQYLFGSDHSVLVDNKPVSVSNQQAGTATTWYLPDCSQSLKLLIFWN